MDRFVSNFTLRLDAKGRVSIPAPYRAVLARDGFDGLYCYPALDQPAVDAGGNALLAEIEALITRYPPYSDERDAFTLALYGTSETLKIDGEGRVILSDALKSHAGITEAISYVPPVKGAREILEKRNPELAQSPLVFPDLKEAHNFKTFSPKDEAEIEAAFQRATGA